MRGHEASVSHCHDIMTGSDGPHDTAIHHITHRIVVSGTCRRLVGALICSPPHFKCQSKTQVVG